MSDWWSSKPERLAGTIRLTPHRILGRTIWGWQWEPNLPGVYVITGGWSLSQDRARTRAVACMRRYQKRAAKWEAKVAEQIVEDGNDYTEGKP